MENKQMSLGDWLITFLLTCIPIVGIVMLFVWAFGSGSQPSRKTWAQAWLVLSLILIVLWIFLLVVGVGIFVGSDAPSLFGI